MFKITSTALDSSNVRIDTTSAEVLGDAYGREFATREAAEEVAADLRATIATYGLPESTEYVVVEIDGADLAAWADRAVADHVDAVIKGAEQDRRNADPDEDIEIPTRTELLTELADGVGFEAWSGRRTRDLTPAEAEAIKAAASRMLV